MPAHQRPDPGTAARRRLIGQTMFTIAVVAWLAAAAASQTPAANQGALSSIPTPQECQHSVRRSRSGRDEALRSDAPDRRSRRVPGRIAELSCPRLAPGDDRRLR